MNRHARFPSVTGRGQTYNVVQGKRQTANITIRYRSCLTVLIFLLRVTFGNADGKKIDDCVPVVHKQFSFSGISVQQNHM